jgi:hypothetical protein
MLAIFGRAGSKRPRPHRGKGTQIDMRPWGELFWYFPDKNTKTGRRYVRLVLNEEEVSAVIATIRRRKTGRD